MFVFGNAGKVTAGVTVLLLSFATGTDIFVRKDGQGKGKRTAGLQISRKGRRGPKENDVEMMEGRNRKETRRISINTLCLTAHE